MLLTKNIRNILLGVAVIIASAIVTILFIPDKEVKIEYKVNWEQYNDMSSKSTYIPTFLPVKYTQVVTKEEPKTDKKVSYVDPDIPDFIEDTGDEEYYNYATTEQPVEVDNSVVKDNTIEYDLPDPLDAGKYVQYEAPSEAHDYNSKTYMKFQTLGYDSWNKQGHLSRQKECITGKYNLRMIDNRILIALGSYYTTTIGQYVDIVLEDGIVIPCILGDQKADDDTDSTHRFHKQDKSVVEFIIDSPGQNRYDYSLFKSLYPSINGNFSNVEEFKSPVKYIRVYDKVYDIDMNDTSGDNPDKEYIK